MKHVPLFPVLALVAFSLVAASVESQMEASVAGFDAAQKSFMVSIWNKGAEDYTDVSLVYRGIDYGVIVPLLRKGTFITLPLESTPGTYTIEMRSGDAVFTQQIEFSMTQTQVKEAQERQAGVLEQQQGQQQREQEALERFVAPEDNPAPGLQRLTQAVAEVPTKTLSLALLSSIIILIFLIIIAVLSQHQRVRQFVQNQFRRKPRIQPTAQPQIVRQRIIQKRQIREQPFKAFDDTQDRQAIDKLRKVE